MRQQKHGCTTPQFIRWDALFYQAKLYYSTYYHR